MQKFLKYFKRDEGFTLIEMALVLFVISVLLLLIIPNIGDHQNTADETGNEALETVVHSQVELYKIGNDGTPSYNQLVESGYLTQSQADKAEEHGISIPSN